MADNRPVIKQVKSGFRITGWLLFSFLFSAALLMGFKLALSMDESRSWLFRLLGIALIGGLAALLYRSVETWAPWLAAFLTMGALRATWVLFSGRSMYRPHEPVPREWTIQVQVYWLAAAVLLFYAKLSKHPRKLRTWEKAGATAVPVSTAAYFATSQPDSDHLWLLATGSTILLVCFLPRLFHSWRRSHLEFSSG